MSENPNELKVVNLEFNIGELFQNATTAFYKYLDGDKGSILQVFRGAVKNRNVSQRAFDLIYRSLLRATTTVIKVNHQDQLDKIKGICVKKAEFKFDLHLMVDFDIGKDFFAAPQNLPLLKEVAPKYEKWLELLGFSSTVAHLLSLELKNHFHLEIIKEWREEATYYQGVLGHFNNNPFYDSWHDKEKQLCYYAELKTLYLQAALGHESLTLADLYVEPNFCVHKNSFKQKENPSANHEGFVIINPDNRLSLHDYINSVLVEGEQGTLKVEGENSRLLLLLGQPGQGKTSFCAKLCNELLNKPEFDKKLFLVKLRDLPNAKEFVNHPIEELEKFLEKKFPLDLSDTVLILDGLDELYISDGLSNSDIKDVFERLIKLVEQKLGLYLILTTRYNYLDFKNLNYKKALTLQLDKLTITQQEEWLDKYNQKEKSIFTKDNLREINKKENGQYESIRELISQPILLQMVVQSGINIDAANNRAAVYDQLFDLMIERKWEKNQLAKYEQIDKEEFRSYLGVLALKIYQSDYEYISYYDIKNLPETKEFLENINNKQGLDDALKDVLVSFYFKNKTKHNDDEDQEDSNGYALEFYHKSLQEYLAAERIYTFIKEEFTEKKRKKNTYVIDKWEIALKTIYDLVHASSLSEQLVAYLVEIIDNDKEEERKIELAQRLTYFLPELLERHFMYEFTNATAVKPLSTASIVFYTYWMILSYCQKDLAERKKMVGPSDKMDFCRLLRLPHKNKYYQMDLSGLDLSESHLSGVKLRGVKMVSANLRETDLTGADLSDGDLSKSDLILANLIGANLVNADLSGAYLRGAYLGGSGLRGAYLRGADLYSVDLRGADLSGADLRGTDLSGADLNGAYFRGARGLNKITNEDLDSF